MEDKNCKYPVTMTPEREEFLKNLRNYHRIVTILIVVSVFVPKKYLGSVILLYIFIFFTNYMIAGNIFKCSISRIEWISSNCENYSIVDDILNLFKLEKSNKNRKLLTMISYIILSMILLIRVFA